MPVETDNGKLAATRLSQRGWMPSLPFGDEGDPDELSEADLQQLLWGFPEIEWGEPVVASVPRVVFTLPVLRRRERVLPVCRRREF